MIGNNQQHRDHIHTIRKLRADTQAGPPRDVKSMTPELRKRLNDRFEKRMARELAGDDVI